MYKYWYISYIYMVTMTNGLKNAIEDENYEYPALVPITYCILYQF